MRIRHLRPSLPLNSEPNGSTDDTNEIALTLSRRCGRPKSMNIPDDRDISALSTSSPKQFASSKRYPLRNHSAPDMDQNAVSIDRKLHRQMSGETKTENDNSNSFSQDSFLQTVRQNTRKSRRGRPMSVKNRAALLVSRLMNLQKDSNEEEEEDDDDDDDDEETEKLEEAKPMADNTNKDVSPPAHEPAKGAIINGRRLRHRDSSVAPVSYSVKSLLKRSEELLAVHESHRRRIKRARLEVRGRRGRGKGRGGRGNCVEECDDDDDDDDDDEEEDTEEEEDEGEETPGGRRYPMRNRRHTDVYQVEHPNRDHHHAVPRDWLAGTPYGESRKRGQYHDQSQSYSGSAASPYLSHQDDQSPDEDEDEKGGEEEDAVAGAGDADLDDRPRRYRPRSRRLHRSLNLGQETATSSATAAAKNYLRQAAAGLMPINLKPHDIESGPLRSRLVAGANLTDIEPMNFDTGVTFDDVGGHQAQIRALQESVLLPLVYPEVFDGFGIEPPRGVLFYGPPGTGKTLLARALANECSRMTANAAQPLGATMLTDQSTTGIAAQAPARPIAFFMRKGADCLSKWVGESERQLRMLFDQAYRMRPSIIFFDEIDGLAPVRSSRQDQIHSSIVSTLLSLMDGLDKRAEVVVIGATNRPDAIDPALRRPGRFDREFAFSLPNETVRRKILEIHTGKWTPPPTPELLDELARRTVGYCGADLKGLATEACLCCLRRQYPQVYVSKMKLAVNLKYLVVDRLDWLEAIKLIRPANLRAELDVGSASATASATALASTSRGCPLGDANVHGEPPANSRRRRLLPLMVEPIAEQVTARIARALAGADLESDCSSDVIGGSMVRWSIGDWPTSPSLIRQIIVESRLLPSSVFPMVWRKLESVEVYTMNLVSLYTASASGEACVVTATSQILAAARRSLANQHRQPVSASSATSNLLGVVLFLPEIDKLLARLPSVACHHLIDRLVEVTTMTTASDSAKRRIILVATVTNLPNWPSLMMSNEEIQSFSRTGPLSIRVPSAGVSPRAPPGVATLGGEVAPIVNGRTPAKTVAWLRSQQEAGTTRRRHPSQLLPPHLPPEINDNGIDGNDFYGPGGGTLPCSSPPPIVPFSSPVSGVGGATTTPATGGDILVRGYLRRLLRFPHVEAITLLPPGEDLRRDYLQTAFIDWLEEEEEEGTDGDGLVTRVHQTAADSSEVSGRQRPPTPPPVLNDTAADILSRRRALSTDELARVRETRDRLLRQLRVQLRCVVARLARDRRFAVFTRPVHPEEAPDYLEVIRCPMDLGSVRDKIDNHQYTSVKEFAADLELIYGNALDYNPPNVPRSRDIRSRAFEFWDAAGILLEENLSPPDLAEQVAEAIAACPLESFPPNSSGRNGVLSGSHHPNQSSTSPLPPGPRYSRRLHGEQPVLDTEESNNPISSPSSRLPRSRPTTHHDDDDDDDPDHTVDLPNHHPQNQHTDADCETSTANAADEAHIDSVLQSPTGSSSPTLEQGQSDPQLNHADLHGTTNQVADYGSDYEDDCRTSPATSVAGAAAFAAVPPGTPLPHPVSVSQAMPIPASLRTSLRSMMGSLLREAVAATRGWSVCNLMALHCDVDYVTQRAKKTLGPQFEPQALKSNIISVLWNHGRMITYERLDDSSSSQNPCYSPPTTL